MSSSTFNAVINLLRADAFMEERFAGGLASVHGLALKEVLMMMHVQHAKGARLSRADLAKRLHISASTVTRMARPLEKMGLIDRESDARDARLTYVVLTKSGKTLLKHAQDTLESMSADFFSDRWSEKEINTLNTLLGRITASLPGNLS
jgi:DNA-binding MarR family transcriptional regulator